MLLPQGVNLYFVWCVGRNPPFEKEFLLVRSPGWGGGLFLNNFLNNFPRFVSGVVERECEEFSSILIPKREFSHCVHATIEVSHAALCCMDLPSLAH